MFLQNSEAKRIEEFLTQLLLEEGGAYTLFGDKPMTDICFFTGEQKDIRIEGLSKESMQTLTYVDNTNFIQNWNAWKKYIKSLSIKQFFFLEIPCPTDPLHRLYFLINIQAVKAIVKEHETDFRLRIGLELSDIEEEIKNPKSRFWSQILFDHYLMGLLHGYGKENSLYFLKLLDGTEKPNRAEFIHQSSTVNTLSLPIYASSPNDPQKEKYLKQRKKIERIFNKKGFLKAVLEKLTE